MAGSFGAGGGEAISLAALELLDCMILGWQFWSRGVEDIPLAFLWRKDNWLFVYDTKKL